MRASPLERAGPADPDGEERLYFCEAAKRNPAELGGMALLCHGSAPRCVAAAHG